MPAPGAIDVWYASTETVGPDALDTFSNTLSYEERCRRDRFVFDRDRRDFTVAHGLTRWALSQCGDTPANLWRFEINAYGKPSVAASQAGTPPLTFNLSHSRGLVTCAVGRGPSLGIDVERADHVSLQRDIAARYFAPAEIRLLDACAVTNYHTTLSSSGC